MEGEGEEEEEEEVEIGELKDVSALRDELRDSAEAVAR